MTRKYHFIRTLPDGRRERDWIEATSIMQARQILQTRGGVLIRVWPARRYNRWWAESVGYLSVRERLLFIRQLALLVSSAMPLSDSLLYLARQERRPRVAEVYAGLHRQISEGKSFSEALRDYQRLFSPEICAVVYAGEKTGHLDEALDCLSEYTENQYRMRAALMQAVLYPALLIVVSVAVILVLMTLAVPQIVGQLTLSGLPLPLSTRILITVSRFLQRNWPLLLLASGGLGGGVILALRHPRIRYLSDYGLLHLPLLGNVIRGTQNSLLLMTLDILIRFSVPALDAFVIIRTVAGNRWIQHRLGTTCSTINRGATIGQALMRSHLLDETTLALLSAGEKSGEFHRMVTFATHYLRKDVHNRLETLLKLLEPVLIFVTGFIVLFIFMSVMQPMLNLNNIAF